MRRLLPNGFPFRRVQTREIFQLHRHALIPGEELLVAEQEIPVERREGSGIVTRGFPGIKTAARAVVAHALDIFPGSDVRLAGHHAAIAVSQSRIDGHARLQGTQPAVHREHLARYPTIFRRQKPTDGTGNFVGFADAAQWMERSRGF